VLRRVELRALGVVHVLAVHVERKRDPVRLVDHAVDRARRHRHYVAAVGDLLADLA
jgi:hypothetical protein